MKEMAAHVDVERQGDDPLRPSDHEVHVRVVRGERLEDLFGACEIRLGRFLAQMLGDRGLAEDLLQETFYEAFRRRDQLGQIGNPEAWLFGVARNLALPALRRRRRFRVALERFVERPDPPTSATISSCSPFATCLSGL